MSWLYWGKNCFLGLKKKINCECENRQSDHRYQKRCCLMIFTKTRHMFKEKQLRCEECHVECEPTLFPHFRIAFPRRRTVVIDSCVFWLQFPVFLMSLWGDIVARVIKFGRNFVWAEPTTVQPGGSSYDQQEQTERCTYLKETFMRLLLKRSSPRSRRCRNIEQRWHW